jgi:hypothetical protein
MFLYGDAALLGRGQVHALQADAELVDQPRPGRVHQPGADDAVQRDEDVDPDVRRRSVLDDDQLGVG